MEGGKGVEPKLGSNEVVVSMVGINEDNKNTQIRSQQKEVHRLKSYVQVLTETISDSSQMPISSFTATTNISSNTPVGTVTEGSSLPHHLISPRMASLADKTNSNTKKGNVRTTSMVEKVPTDTCREDNDDDEDEEDEIDDGGAYATENYKAKQKKDEKWEVMYILEFTICTCIIAVFITSLSVPKLHHDMFWGLEIWRWCVLLWVIFGGGLMAGGFTNFLVFLIERNFVLKKKVLYFVHSLKRSVQVFFWLALVLLTWVVLIRKKLKEPKNTTVVLRHITRFLVSSLFGAGLWVIKTLLVKILACSFHVKRFFDRIQDSIFHQYVLLTLSEPPMGKNQRLVAKIKLVLILRKLMKGKIVEKQVIDVEKLSKMIKDTVSAWTISGLVNVIQGSGLATISGALDGSVDITNEEDAKRAGDKVFMNVTKAAGHNSRYINEADLLLFLKKDDVDKVFNMFNCSAESRKIKRTAMRDWVVKVYKERELLAQSIKDAKTAIEEMNKILSGIALIVIIVVWLVLMGLATTQMLVFISSQLLVATFIFGNSCKTGFECILFIFVMHPFDVGDHCVIDGVQMTVEEMNILTTVFKSDKETIVYPNSVLATKPISNFYRSRVTSENVEFVINVLTSADIIAKMKSKIKEYIEKKHKQWYPNHQFKEIKNGNKLKMVLYVNPTTEFPDYGENSNRRPELLHKIKEIFEELEIKYHYLPQEVHLSNV